MDVGATRLDADEPGAPAEDPVAAIRAKSMTSLRLNMVCGVCHACHDEVASPGFAV